MTTVVEKVQHGEVGSPKAAKKDKLSFLERQETNSAKVAWTRELGIGSEDP